MIEKNYISRGENRLWEHIKEKEIIDSELARDIFPDMASNSRNKILHSLYKKGYLRRARKGLYYNPQTLKSFHELALRTREGYIAFASALRHYNLIEYEDFTIFLATKNYRARIPLEGTKYEIQCIPLKNLYTGFEKKGGIYVSTIEKTFFDCLLRPKYTGYSILTKALHSAKINWKEFMGYFKLTDNSSLCQRTGFLLELMKDNTGFSVPEHALDFLSSKVGSPVKLAPLGGKTKFSRRWKIQDNMGKERILSWWI
jgi:predicted transcriptional regulator of viral defense system